MVKNPKAKKCEKSHVADLPTYPIRGFTYQNKDGNIYIDAFSVFKMLKDLGLKEHAISFISVVADIHLKKD